MITELQRTYVLIHLEFMQQAKVMVCCHFNIYFVTRCSSCLKAPHTDTFILCIVFWNCVGGGFVNLLACTPSIAAKFAAFSTVSAAFYTTTFNRNCPTERSIPILDFHGTADTVTPYNGRKAHGGIQVSIDDFLQFWVLRNDCQGNATISHLSKEMDPHQLVEIQTWNNNCKPGSIVIEYRITGGQHSWPRITLPMTCNGKVGTNDCSTTVFDATSSVIIPFFNNYSL